jgi:hypothetical protein
MLMLSHFKANQYLIILLFLAVNTTFDLVKSLSICVEFVVEGFQVEIGFFLQRFFRMLE